ncbi:MAG: hypothetical protein LBH97_01490 [Treponema sp.]|jgi:hypothetical protein|nr:hypothetical protein [Treponema sp.]
MPKIFFIDDKPLKCNMMWGSDYMLMDSNTFMGGSGGSQYEEIIGMFAKIWEIEGCNIIFRNNLTLYSQANNIGLMRV